MYIQITTYCNMSCAHCCVSCGRDKIGQHMSLDTYRQAVKLASSLDWHISLGGGEPTLHPEFWKFFGIAMEAGVDSVWMATNGSITKRALALAALASADAYGDGHFNIALSQDDFHDPIDQRVIDAFKRLGHEIRSVNYSNVLDRGHAHDNDLGGKDRCACDTTYIRPDGTVTMCGCNDSLVLGNVYDVNTDRIARAITLQQEHGVCGQTISDEERAYVLEGEELEDVA